MLAARPLLFMKMTRVFAGKHSQLRKKDSDSYVGSSPTKQFIQMTPQCGAQPTGALLRFQSSQTAVISLRRHPGGGHGNPVRCSCWENPHGQSTLVGYTPRGHKESDTTEATVHTFTLRKHW